MPQQLDRITSDPQKHFGIPFILDTGITVSEIISQIMSGKTVADILQAYPTLEAQDIEQVLVYQIEQAHEKLAFWIVEGTQFLTSIEMGHQILFKYGSRITEEDRKSTIEETYANIYLAMGAWRHYLHSLSAPSGHLEKHPLSLKDIMWRVNSLLRYEPQAALEANLPNDALEVYSNGGVGVAIFNLIAVEATNPKLNKHAFLTVRQELKSLIFQIYREFKAIDSSTSEFEYFIMRGSPLQTAALIIHQSGSELKAIPSETGVTFEFALPIYNQTQPE